MKKYLKRFCKESLLVTIRSKESSQQKLALIISSGPYHLTPTRAAFSR
jgi:hypothetical protein